MTPRALWGSAFVFALMVPNVWALDVNCGAYSLGSAVSISAPNEDLFIKCPLAVGSLVIKAKSITVDGPAGGSIQTTTKAGIKLLAGLNDNGTACGSGATPASTIAIKGALIEDQNTNGGIVVKSCGSQDLASVPGSSLLSQGAAISLECFHATCEIDMRGLDFDGNRVEAYAQADITIRSSQFNTVGPRDIIKLVSYHGAVDAGRACSSLDIFPWPDGFITREQACALCNCDGGNFFRGGIESNLFVFGDTFVDLSGDCIEIAENITITANGGDPGVVLRQAEIRNDFGKPGNISILAGLNPALIPTDVPNQGSNYAGSATGIIDIADAIIVDDGGIGGGVDFQAVAYMNKTKPFIAGNCGATPKCNPRAIPPRGYIANSAMRAPGVTGLALCDS